MSESSRLHIHTHMTPEADPEPIRPAKKPFFRRRRASRLSRTDRLLRDSALACAVLLGVLALGNIDAPWAKRLSGGIGRALTMRIDLDDSIGELSFVRRLMPESALVFLNVSGGSPLHMPVEGEITHAWSRQQPWLMLGCEENAPVRACADGTVTAVSPLSGGLYGVLVDHGEALESTYANLIRVDVKAGDTVVKGQALGTASENLFFEYRSGGESIDPGEGLGLS